MKTKTTLLKFSVVALFLILCNAGAFAGTYYACVGTNVTFTPDAITGITYKWDVKDNATGTSLAGYPRLAAPSGLAVGSYKVLLLSEQTTPSATDCPPDVVENTVIILPALSLVLDNPTNPSYCSANSTISSSVIGQTTTGFSPTYATDLDAEYTYTVKKDAEAEVGGTVNDANGTPMGSIDANGKYTLLTKIPGSYVITAKVKYKKKTASTANLLAACESASSASKTVTVTPKPTAPTITITAS